MTLRVAFNYGGRSELADAAASEACIPEKGAYYHAFNRDWSRKEIREKIRVYRLALEAK